MKTISMIAAFLQQSFSVNIMKLTIKIAARLQKDATHHESKIGQTSLSKFAAILQIDSSKLRC
ncbi:MULTISPECIES: hypothetical protein [Pantoea]|uniref:hypothetical protein n=1 Tax=Pantoea TaxID=53335 RepID=UPI00076B5456|nr:hypothetical protein [Pantoea vagans]AMG56133.1 hypothetical protein AL522_00020 [Pantoea vagans]